ncbi:MAG: oxygen-dependent coproporphyrinogen oxidase [Saprospiraceae bacterium]|nr:oxygen-dependent coproporphyrinogen oxidase [Saprospiraceae bacterium]
MDDPKREEIQAFFMGLQDRICAGLEELDGTGTFHEDKWERPEGGGGRSRVIEGQKIEKGGVNFSAVEGHLPERISKALNLAPTDFYATGVSIVLHPKNPHVPIIHMNVRYFETSVGKYWFGGGIDVTPHYIYDEDAIFFHKYLKEVGDKHDSGYYPHHKKWADDYFYIQHRKETRGIGGIFFDRLEADETHTKRDRFNYVKDVGNAFVTIYKKLVDQNQGKEFSEQEKDWQYHRRGRYVEFNLVWDKGTKFGLQTNGRIESILMSMPPEAKWTYNHAVAKDSPEQRTLDLLIKGIDWASK